MPWRRKWQTTPVSCLGNSIDREDWKVIVHGVSMSWTGFSDSTIKTKIKTLSPGKESKYRENLLFRVCVCVSPSGVCDSVQSHRLESTRLLHPWNCPGKNSEVGFHSLLQPIFLTQGSNPGLQHCRQTLLPSEPPGKTVLGKYFTQVNL